MVEKGETITHFMMLEHGKLNDLLTQFMGFIEHAHLDQETKTHESSSPFKDYKAREFIHMATEDRIFTQNKKMKNLPLTQTLKEQHKTIREMIKKIEEKAEQNLSITENIAKLQTFLQNHTELEEKEFYPEVDKEIIGQEKEELLTHIENLLEDN